MQEFIGGHLLKISGIFVTRRTHPFPFGNQVVYHQMLAEERVASVRVFWACLLDHRHKTASLIMLGRAHMCQFKNCGCQIDI